MKAHILISLCLTACVTGALMTVAPAETKPKPGDLAELMIAVKELQSDVKALQASIATLASSQNAEAAQIKDVSRRLYATCVLTQRLMDVTVPGGWSENALCNYKGLTAAGQPVEGDIFGRNPTNIDTPFGER